ncbi:MAG: cytidylate kinase-like family protein [Deltaproteobacteria bacterium]|nr:cytidylate kinase-like family protein [Deltaproteobacteria bacterium]
MSESLENWNKVESQIAKWNSYRDEHGKALSEPKPVITISREPGCGASQIAHDLAIKLGMDLMDSEILHMIAESAEVSEKVINTVDEKELTLRENMLNALFAERYLPPDSYLQVLTKVVSAISLHGNAIIMGRGVNFVLPPKETFRIRIIGPEDLKIKNCSQTGKEDAKQYIRSMEEQRKVFAQKYFHADIDDSHGYDIVINMQSYTTAGAVEALATAFAVWKA